MVTDVRSVWMVEENPFGDAWYVLTFSGSDSREEARERVKVLKEEWPDTKYRVRKYAPIED